MFIAGLDIGGTKCAVSLGRIVHHEDTVEILAKREIPHSQGLPGCLACAGDALEGLLNRHGGPVLKAIGISWGGASRQQPGPHSLAPQSPRLGRCGCGNAV